MVLSMRMAERKRNKIVGRAALSSQLAHLERNTKILNSTTYLNIDK